MDSIRCYEWMIHNFGFTKELGCYALIYSYHERGEACDLSKNQMAAYLGCSYAQIVRCVCALRDGGFITVTERGAPQTTLYQIDADAAEKLKAIYRTARGGEKNG